MYPRIDALLNGGPLTRREVRPTNSHHIYMCIIVDYLKEQYESDDIVGIAFVYLRLCDIDHIPHTGLL